MAGFRYFVVLAGMRTGSNFLEANLNLFADLSCEGELFNPTFVGHHNKSELFGFDLEKRERSPLDLIETMIETRDEIPGFRLFHDHDPRALTHVLADESCAKIVLSRDEIDSFVSLKIAAKTKQWKLSDIKQRRGAVITFDPQEFELFRADRLSFRHAIASNLKSAGQSWFDLDYEELGNVDILNGLARYIGSGETVKTVSTKLKRQNPGELSEKVSNHAEMVEYLAAKGSSRPSDMALEQERGALVKSYVRGKSAPLLFMPLPGCPGDAARQWMADLEGITPDDLPTGMTQSELWGWRKATKPHRSFTIIRPPLERAHDAFCLGLLTDTGSETRKIIRNRYGVPLPRPVDLETEAYSIDDHKAAFDGFLKFLKGNLAGQTSVGTEPAWVPQSAYLSGIGRLNCPDLVIRDHELPEQLAHLSHVLGLEGGPVAPRQAKTLYELSDIEDSHLHKRAFQLYRKDYISFGFEKPF